MPTRSLMEDEQLQKLIGAAIAYISIHPRSEAEIRAYLAKRAVRCKMPKIAIVEALERLIELHMVDDAAYARVFVESRMKSRPKGERLIQLELKTKGVQQSIIDSICSEYFHGSTGESSEHDLARKAISKKMHQWKTLPVREQKQKIYRFLASRGFASASIYTIIDEVIDITYNRDN